MEDKRKVQRFCSILLFYGFLLFFRKKIRLNTHTYTYLYIHTHAYTYLHIPKYSCDNECTKLAIPWHEYTAIDICSQNHFIVCQ